MLVLDELHNVLAAPTHRQRELLNLLRYLGNELRIPLACLGTREAYLAIRSDDQLENRFEPLLLPSWEDDPEFGRLLASFEAVLPLREPSGLGAPKMRAGAAPLGGHHRRGGGPARRRGGCGVQGRARAHRSG
ncbi:TniB family NTP-binding protein [Paeniroseomonas aquatica]